MDTNANRDLIDNEVLRLKIQNHINFENWYISMQPQIREIFHAIMESDVTPHQIFAAQNLPEWQTEGFDFLGAIAGGNPDPSITRALTNVVLGEILWEVDTFGEEDSEDTTE